MNKNSNKASLFFGLLSLVSRFSLGLLALWLCLLGISLSGCSQESDTNTDSEIGDTAPVPEDSLPKDGQYLLPHIRTKQENLSTKEEGTLLVKMSISYPVFQLPENSTALMESLEKHLQETYNSWRGDHDRLYQDARAELARGSFKQTYQEDIVITCEAVGSLLSLSTVEKGYAGGLGETIDTYARLYNPRNGNFIDILSLSKNQTVFSEFVQNQLTEDGKKLAVEGLAPSLTEAVFENWYKHTAILSEEGLQILFNPGELSTEQTETLRFLLTREEITPFLSEEGKQLTGFGA